MAEIIQYRKERLDRGIKVRSDGIYAISHWMEMTYLIGPRLGLIMALIIFPLLPWVSLYWKKVFEIACAYAVLAISFDFLAHYVGLVNLGSSLFTGVGGYFAAVYNLYLGLEPWISIPLASVTGACLCTLLLLPCLPLRGVYFAIVTLIYPLFLTRIIEAWNILGGTNGLPGISGFPNFYCEALCISFAALFFLFGIRRFSSEDIGIVLKGIKDNDQAIKACGINITWMKALAVFIAALMGCFSGAYIVHAYMWAGLSLFALDFSVIPIASVVIGGTSLSGFVGGVVGSFILVPLSEALRVFGTLRIVIYCMVMLFFIIWKSEGIVDYLWRKYYQFEKLVKI